VSASLVGVQAAMEQAHPGAYPEVDAAGMAAARSSCLLKVDLMNKFWLLQARHMLGCREQYPGFVHLMGGVDADLNRSFCGVLRVSPQCS
jgi:hypothetical protein